MTQETEPQNQTDAHEPNIGAMFAKYANQSKDNPEATVEKREKKENKAPEVNKKEVNPEVKLKSKEEDRVENKPKEASIDWKSEVEKLQHNLKETRKWGDETKRQLSAYKKVIEKFKEEGNLNEEEATELLNHTKYQELENKNKSFSERAGEVWDKEIENIRKYSDYPELDRHLHAFQHFIQNGTREEVEDAHNDIKDLIDSNPILFTKKMLEIGKRYHDEIFSDLVDAGNLKNFKKQYEEKLEGSQRKIDKLEKEIAKLKDKYEGYDENPNYRMPQGGDSGGVGSTAASTKRPGQLIEKFNSGQYSFGR